MKLKLNKKKLKNLSDDNKSLPVKMTPQIGGAAPPPSHFCNTKDTCDTYTFVTFYCY
ncbi:hypothetical protein [Pseudoalteromonas denitrificans]|uniref:Uncharacterized protein n=1 Tax=Pseudoalteromonas denitrificans DSM 6059 TaxID=1123010 RepID=A0A1I1R0J0_9GAMM|nr:hypothetical protein [Pseudoalteromonas denitrificans]SFD27737.1 hypothetical protein SAMN02745724_04071 [Pseudoalteromonas denitrificans DSM 6059]